MPFPRDRFARAGAGPEQLAELEAVYDALSPQAQESYEARLSPLSDYEISEQLLGAAVEPEDAAEPEDEEAEPEVEALTAPGAPPSSERPVASSGRARIDEGKDPSGGSGPSK